jgi:predicted nucleotide-binding protein
LEAGFFIGLLGRSRVAVVYESGVELPSDLAGLIYIPLDPAGGWRLDLLKELEAAKIEVDRARMP